MGISAEEGGGSVLGVRGMECSVWFGEKSGSHLQPPRHPQWGIQGDSVANGTLKPRKLWVDRTFQRMVSLVSIKAESEPEEGACRRCQSCL